MKKLINLGTKQFHIPDGGTSHGDDSLTILFLLNESDNYSIDDIEKMLLTTGGLFNLYDDSGENVLETYKGFTRIRSIQKIYDYQYEDGKATAISATVATPSIQDMLNDVAAKNSINTEDISAINEAIADLAASVGGE